MFKLRQILVFLSLFFLMLPLISAESIFDSKDIFGGSIYELFVPDDGDIGYSCNDNMVGYATNHVILLSNPSYQRDSIIEPHLLIDLDMRDEEISNLKLNPNSMGYYQRYVYEGGWCELPDTRYASDRDLLPAEGMIPYEIKSVTYCCDYDSNADFNIFEYIFLFNQTKNIESYLTCDYRGDNRTNYTVALNVQYQSSEVFMNNNGRLKAIFSQPTWTGEGINIFKVENYILEYYTNYRDTNMGYIPDKVKFTQEFHIPIQLSNLTNETSGVTENTIELTYPQNGTGTSEFYNQSSQIQEINQLADKNTETQDNLEMQKQKNTNEKMTALKNNNLVIDFLISVCEFIISLVMVLYYFIVIAILLFILTVYVPKIIMIIPNILERMIFNGGKK